jgi:ATP-binding cassette subfamily B protein
MADLMADLESWRMDELSRLAGRPYAFIFRYVQHRALSHFAIFAAVLGAVACSITTQYGVKYLVDVLSDPARSHAVWLAFAVLVALIAADNILWRLAGWIASCSFVRVTGDLRRDLFRHLTGHSPSYFADRLPGMLTSRITATSNAVFTAENMFVWNVMPPCAAMVGAIAFVTTISVPMALTLSAIGGVVVIAMFRLAAAGKPLHHAFADRAAAVDGEMVDVIGNMPLVRAFCGLRREHQRFDRTVRREMTARQRSLLYLERLRLIHAVVTILLTVGLLAWAILLWQERRISTGDVVLACTLGLSVLHATRDLAVALVDVTQHLARLSEAISTLLIPHDLRDHPEAAPLERAGASVEIRNVAFRYPGGAKVFDNLNLRLAPGQRVGLVGQSGGGKSTLFALLQRFYDVQHGGIFIDGQDIRRVTQESLGAAIAVVQQDVSLFHRSVRENIRYGRPDASDEAVQSAASAARCLEFIQAMPQGMATVVGDRGVKLSGGERQRIAIARALLKDAPLLLLDEATSALDSESEEAVREALSDLMRGRTVIAIAHRLSTIRNVDRIIVLQGGRVMQDGAPGELSRQPGPYRDLLRLQQRGNIRDAA